MRSGFERHVVQAEVQAIGAREDFIRVAGMLRMQQAELLRRQAEDEAEQAKLMHLKKDAAVTKAAWTSLVHGKSWTRERW